MNNVDDVLLPFIDDKLCNIVGNSKLKHYIFEETSDAMVARRRLEQQGCKNWSMLYANSILSYSEEIKRSFEFFFKDVKPIYCNVYGYDESEVIYYRDKDTWILYWNKNNRKMYCNNYWKNFERDFFEWKNDDYVIKNLFISCVEILIEQLLDIKEACYPYFPNYGTLIDINAAFRNLNL